MFAKQPRTIATCERDRHIQRDRLPRQHCPSHQFMVDPVVEVMFVLVHPDLGQPDAVPAQHVHPGAPLVRRALPEDVAHVAAGHDLQPTSAHPNLQHQAVSGTSQRRASSIHRVLAIQETALPLIALTRQSLGLRATRQPMGAYCCPPPFTSPMISLQCGKHAQI